MNDQAALEQNHPSYQDEGQGALILVVGPSGSGKDSVMNWAKERLEDRPDVQFVRRNITRVADPDGENHNPMSVAEFQKAELEGKFVISWGAHGLFYGLPNTLLDHMAAGGVAIANGSRKTIPLLQERFKNFRVANIQVEPHILAQRLASRGRESAEQIEARLKRTQQIDCDSIFDDATHHIDNSGDISLAGQKLLDLIEQSLLRSSKA